MKEYLDILRLGLSEGLTAGQRAYLIQKIRKSLTDEDYISKREQINLCLFKDEVIQKARQIIKKFKQNKRGKNLFKRTNH